MRNMHALAIAYHCFMQLGLRKEYFWIEVYCFVCSFYLGTFESPKSLSIEEQ